MAMMSQSKIIPILLDIQSKIENPTMKSWNPFTKSPYTSLNDLLDLIKPYLIENELLLFQNTCNVDGELAVQTSLIHKSGEKFSMGKMVVPLQHNNPQGLGAAITYGRRYQLVTLFNIIGEKDDDGNSNSQKGTTSSKPNKSTSKSQDKPTSQSKADKPQGKPTSKPTNSKPNNKPANKPNNKPSNKPNNKPSNKPANKPKVTESKLSDGTKIQEAKGSKPGGKPVAETVEDPEDSNKLLAILQKEQSKLYMPLKKKFKGITKERDTQITSGHIIQACQELLGENVFTPDDVGLVKETLDI